MINFADGFDPNKRNIEISKEQIAELVKAIMENKNKYLLGSYHGGLGLEHIKEIINYLMYSDKNDCIELLIEKENDGYHLALTILDKYKYNEKENDDNEYDSPF